MPMMSFPEGSSAANSPGYLGIASGGFARGADLLQGESFRADYNQQVDQTRAFFEMLVGLAMLGPTIIDQMPGNRGQSRLFNPSAMPNPPTGAAGERASGGDFYLEALLELDKKDWHGTFTQETDNGRFEMFLAGGGTTGNLKPNPGFVQDGNSSFITRNPWAAYGALGLGIGGFISVLIGSAGAAATQ